MMKSDILFLCELSLIFISFVSECSGSEICINTFYDEVHVCEYGCCGSGPDYECCNIVALIAASIFGGVIIISIFAFFICCFLKKAYRPTRIVNTEISENRNITTIFTGRNQRLDLSLYSSPPPPYNNPTLHLPPYAPACSPPPYQSRTSLTAIS